MRIYLMIPMLISLFFIETGLAQEVEKENILTLSLVKEPVTLQRGRIKGDLAYMYNFYDQYYNSIGRQSRIIDRGFVSSMNQLYYSVEYGLTDRVQFGLYHSHNSGYEGYETITKLYVDGNYIYTYIKEINGFSDILLNIGYKIPIKNKKIDISIFPGIMFPISRNPRESEHTITTFITDSGKNINVDFTSFEKVGTGTFRFELAGKAKFRFNDRLALLLYGKYNFPLVTTQSFFWKTIYNGTRYYNIQNECIYSPQNVLFGNLECQFVPDRKEIMGLKLGLNLTTNTNGWCEVDEIKTDTPNSLLCRTYAGLELIVTGHIRFSQQFWYDVAGKNTKGAIGTQTLLTINFLKR